MPTACVCVVQMSLLTHSLFVRRSAFTDSAFLPLNTTAISFFLSLFSSFILSLPRSASPKTHCLLATKAFSAKNKWPSHDRQDKIWFNYRNLPKEFRVWAQLQRATVWGCDLSKAAWPAETSRYSAGFTVTLYLQQKGHVDLSCKHWKKEFTTTQINEPKILYINYILLVKTYSAFLHVQGLSFEMIKRQHIDSKRDTYIKSDSTADGVAFWQMHDWGSSWRCICYRWRLMQCE